MTHGQTPSFSSVEGDGSEKDDQDDHGEVIRMCLVSRRRYRRDEMIRFVCSPEGCVVPDLAGRLPGRGVWIWGGRQNLAIALKKNLFARGFGKKIHIEVDLLGEVSLQLRRAALGWLSLCRKGGEVIFGYSRVEKAVRSGGIWVPVVAVEASQSGVDSLFGFGFSKVFGKKEGVCVSIFSAHELGQILSGGGDVMYAGLLRSCPVTEAFVAAAARYSSYEGAALCGERVALASFGCG